MASDLVERARAAAADRTLDLLARATPAAPEDASVRHQCVEALDHLRDDTAAAREQYEAALDADPDPDHAGVRERLDGLDDR